MEVTKFALSFAFCFASASCFAQRYSITYPAAHGGAISTTPGAMNAFGAVVGSELGAPETLTFSGFVSARGELTHLLGLGDGAQTEALGISNKGAVTGYTSGSDGNFHAFVWVAGTLSLLTEPPGSTGSSGYSINSSGTVAGFTRYGFTSRAAIFRGTQWLELPSFGGNSVASQIDDGGHVAGTVTDAGGVSRAFFWNGSRMFALGTLGGRDSEGRALNRLVVVGGAQTPDGHFHPCAFANGKVIDLGLLSGCVDGWATSINSRGDIVGFCRYDEFNTRAFLYSRGRIIALDALIGNGLFFSTAVSINDRGQIFAGSLSGATILTPLR